MMVGVGLALVLIGFGFGVGYLTYLGWIASPAAFLVGVTAAVIGGIAGIFIYQAYDLVRNYRE